MNTHHSQGYKLPDPEEISRTHGRGSMFPVALLTIAIILVQVFFVLGMGTKVLLQHTELFLLINGILALLICLTNPYILFIGVASYLPFIQTSIRVEIGVITFTPFSLGMILLTGLALVRKVLLNKPLNLGRSDLFLVLICASFLVSTVFAKDIMDSGLIAFKSIFIPVLCMFTARIMLDTPGKYRQFVRIFLISLVLFGVAAIYSYLASGRRAIPFGVQPIGTGALLYASVCFLATTKYFPRLLRYVAMGLCLIGMAMTYSRVLILVTLASPVIYLIIRRGKSLLMFTAFFIFTLSSTLLLVANIEFFIPDRYFASDQEIHDSSERVTNIDHWKLSLYQRILTFDESLERFQESPLFGTGLQSSFFGATTQHNFNMEWLEYGGIFGYILLLAFYLSHVQRVARAAVHDRVLCTNLLVLFGIFCNAFFNGIFHGFNAPLAYLVMGLSEARMSFPAPEDRR